MTSSSNAVTTMTTTISQVPKKIQQFSPLEDLIIYCLDTLCPCDISFISNHISNWNSTSIEKHLNDQDYWKNVSQFKKLPLFIFEIIFIKDGHWVSRSLMLLTTKRLIPLQCKQDSCIHEFTIPQAKLHYCHQTSHGINTPELCKFISTNCKKEHIPLFSKEPREIDEFLKAAKLNFRDFNLSANVNVEKQESQELKSRHKIDPHPIIIDAMGEIHMKPHHQQTLKNIIKAIGKNKWSDATLLLLDHYEHIVDFDAEDTEIFKRMASYYRQNLDPDPHMGDFSREEEKCVIFLYKTWEKTLQGEGLWQHISRHMPGRNAGQIKHKFLRQSTGINDMTLANIKQSPDDLARPAVFFYNKGHVISLTIFPKTTSGMDVTERLQKEVRFLVMGTREEMFLVPCRYSALRCSHVGMQQEKFTYDPTRPAEQFLNFVRLTFTNALKKAGLVDRQNFHFTDLVYKGEDIHEIMTKIEKERFLIPKPAFMKLNRSQVNFPISVTPPTMSGAGQKRNSQGGNKPNVPAVRGRGRPRKIVTTETS